MRKIRALSKEGTNFDVTLDTGVAGSSGGRNDRKTRKIHGDVGYIENPWIRRSVTTERDGERKRVGRSEVARDVGWEGRGIN